MTTVTTSWDDGHPHDLRLAELLAEHGVRGTFYIPVTHPGFQPIGRNMVRSLREMGMEIGAHTVTHTPLTHLLPDETAAELRGGKETLEDWLGEEVTSFCYPEGKFSASAVQLVRETGFRYARTSVAFRTDPGPDPLRTPVSLQFWPHSSAIHVRHALKEFNWGGLVHWMARWRARTDLLSLSEAIFEHAQSEGGVFHLWGHSWEIEEAGLWSRLEGLLRRIARNPGVQYCTNRDTQPVKKKAAVRRAAMALLLACMSVAMPGWAADSVIHVDAARTNASDRNPGTAAEPLRTVTRAAEIARENNRRGIGARVLIEPGIYREQILLPPGPGVTPAPIVFEAATPGSVLVSGSDVWTGWRREGGAYSRQWPYDWDLAPYPDGWQPYVRLSPIVRRREMIFVNGTPASQVLSLSELTDNTFFVSNSGSTVYLRPAAGVNLESALVEVALRPRLFAAQGRHNVTLRGIRFAHAATALPGSAVEFSDSDGVTVENCSFEWNNWQGLGFLSAGDAVVRGNRANHNGGLGMGGYRMRNAQFENNETSVNNLRGARGGFHDWAVAGSKFVAMHGGVFRNHKAVGNLAIGLWFDYNTRDVAVNGAVLCGNLREGLVIEASEGPFALRGSTVCFNVESPGVLGATASDVHLTDNLLIGNGVSQVRIAPEQVRLVTDWEAGRTSEVMSTRWTMTGNVVVSVKHEQQLFSCPNWPHFFGSLVSRGNSWSAAGLWPMAQGFYVGQTWLGITEWQLLAGGDPGSTYSANP